MKLNCREAKDVAMMARLNRIAKSPLDPDDKALLEKISSDILDAIWKHEDCIRIEIGTQMYPKMSHRIIELIRDHCKANEFVVNIFTNFLNDQRHLEISGW